MKKFFLAFLLISVAFCATAQDVKRHKIALVTPLYLDSAFDAGGGYRFDKTFPKYLNSGMEFYMGAQAALDSLNKAGAPLEVYVIDSRGKQNLSDQVNGPYLQDVEMIIANANATEVRLLSDVAEKKKIPFISATLPNDANVKANPYLVVLNSTLRAHAEGIYRYVQKYHALDNVILLTKNGSQENQLREYIEDYAKHTKAVPLEMKVELVGSAFNANVFTQKLDSNARTVVISASLDEAFSTRVLQQLATIAKTYPLTVIGMPTWDGINLAKNEYKNLELVYSTPFHYTQPNSLATRLANDYSSKQSVRASDMFFRGYETMLRFALLLLDAKTDVASSLARKGNVVFTSFDIQPVFLDRSNLAIDYYENRHLYFIRYQNGAKSLR